MKVWELIKELEGFEAGAEVVVAVGYKNTLVFELCEIFPIVGANGKNAQLEIRADGVPEGADKAAKKLSKTTKKK